MLDFATGTPPLLAHESSVSVHASPKVGRSLGGRVTAVNQPIREAVSIFAVHSAPAEIASLLDQATRVPTNCGGIIESASIRSAWLIVSAALLHARATKSLATHPLLVSLSWFIGDGQLADRLRKHYGTRWQRAEHALCSANLDAEFWSLLPYVLEPDGHVTRSEFETCESSRERKAKKRSSGAFYTPGDVATFMASSVFKPNATWFDPACGTGVFLRAAIEVVQRRQPDADIQEFTQGQLFAVDRSALATDLASVVVVEKLLSSETAAAPLALWQRIKQNIICADAQKIRPPSAVGDLFSADTQTELEELFGARCAAGFDVLIVNPPYASTQIASSDRQWWDVVPPEAVRLDAQTVFTEMMWKFTSIDGLAIAVLPLSVGANTSSSYRLLRREMCRQGGRKTFLFFDREPQALFGEDIKTRNVILLIDKQHPGSDIHTSGLLKWTAEQRASIFTFNRATPLGKIGIERFVPKLASPTEQAVYAGIRHPARPTEHAISVSRASLAELLNSQTDHNLYITGTAYNFLNVFRADGLPPAEPSSVSSSPLIRLPFEQSTKSFAALSVLASRLMFWLWHVESDGFHVSSDFIQRCALWTVLHDKAAARALAAAGKRHWEDCKQMAMRSVNGGKVTFSFHSGYDTPFYSEVDRVMLDALGIAESTEFLDQFISNAVHVGGVRRDRRSKQQ